MSCTIPTETKGFIDIPEDKWEKFIEFVVDNMTDYYLTPGMIRLDDLSDLEPLVDNEFIDSYELQDIETHCDAVEFSKG